MHQSVDPTLSPSIQASIDPSSHASIDPSCLSPYSWPVPVSLYMDQYPYPCTWTRTRPFLGMTPTPLYTMHHAMTRCTLTGCALCTFWDVEGVTVGRLLGHRWVDDRETDTVIRVMSTVIRVMSTVLRVMHGVTGHAHASSGHAHASSFSSVTRHVSVY